MCVIISIAAVAEWLSQGKPRICADDKRVAILPNAIREAGMLKAKEAYRILRKPSKQMGLEIRSIVNGSVYPAHRRDLRTLHLFISECAMADAKAERGVHEVDGNDERTARLYNKEGGTDVQTFFIVAYNGHMRFARQTEYAAPKKWKMEGSDGPDSCEGCFAVCGNS